MADLARVYNQVKARITPRSKLRIAVQAKAEELRTAVEAQCAQAGLAAEVRIDGSIAKDTWLRDFADVDIFMRVSPGLTKAQLRDICLPIARRALRPNRILERFAEHPYVESYVPLGKHGPLRVNVVPCYNVEKGHWLSATDRTPYHTEYILNHLTPAQHDEVRLLKAFMRRIGAYGADIKTGGFSGMLCETLVVSKGDFQSVAAAFSAWEGSGFIDVENYFDGRRDEVHRLFHEPLIVIDPVDKGRNLAAAVRSEQLWNFVAASRQLINKPTASLFKTPKIAPLTAAGYRRLVERRGSALLAVVVGRLDVVVDILWSQLYRTERALTTHLEKSGFSVVKSRAWSDEKSFNVILFELEQATLPPLRLHRGPPISRLTESASFLAKHAHGKGTVSGPWIEGDRWVVERRREYTSAVDLLRASLKSGGGSIGVASEPARAFRNRVQILTDDSITRLIKMNRAFAQALAQFLSGRPSWLG